MSHPLDASLSPQAVFARLDAVVQELIIACQTLYGGNWDDCAEDVRRRQNGQPYIYRLKLQVEDIFGWLTQLKTYEKTRGECFAAVIENDARTSSLTEGRADCDTGATNTAFLDTKDQH